MGGRRVSRKPRRNPLYTLFMSLLGLTVVLLVTVFVLNAKLRTAPCRYWGSVYDNSLVILGHNYLDHFGRLKSLELGDPIQFIDADGNIYRYEVVQQETLEKTDVDAMQDSPYDLTLFTCAHGGERRIVVRARGSAP